MSRYPVSTWRTTSAGKRAGHTVNRGHPGADTRIGPDLLDRCGQVGEKAVGHPGQGMAQRDRDVHRGGTLQAIEAPAAAAHVLHDLVNVKAVIGGERDDPERVAEHPQPGYGRDTIAYSRPGRQDPPGRFGVAVLADRHHGRPAGGGQGAGPAAGQRGGQVEPARPVGHRVVLELPQFPAPVQHDRRALGRIAVLVRVGRHRGHAGQPEVEGRYRIAQPPRPRQDEPAEAGIDVTAHAAFGR